MKGLLIKDICVLGKQMKIYIFIIIIFAFIPNFATFAYAMILAAMLPMTALAYDEQSKWNRFALMMPYTKKDIVISKYILGYLLVFGIGSVSAIAQIFIVIIRKQSMPSELFMQFLFTACGAFLIQAVNMPFLFRMGVEKGRLIFIVFVIVFVLTGTFFDSAILEAAANIKVNMTYAAIALCFWTVIVNVVSMIISVMLYNNKYES